MSRSAKGRTFPSAREMDRLVTVLLTVLPSEIVAASSAIGLDLQALIRFRPLAELLRLAREARGWSVTVAGRAHGVSARDLRRLESAEYDRIAPEVLVGYATRLGAVHLLAEWVTANPALAVEMGLPDEPTLLARSREIQVESARLGSLVPGVLGLAVPRRFEAPPEFARALDPRLAGEHLADMILHHPFSTFSGVDAGSMDQAADEGAGHAGLSTAKARRDARPGRSEARAIYRLKITLQGVRPTVWRRLEVSSEITCARLHQVIQRVMGWEDRHLHEFRHGDICIGVPDPEWPHPVVDEHRVRLADLGLSPKTRLLYHYDFGDNWVHTIALEKVLVFDPSHSPVCLEGKRACPPEDCGGIPGYQHVVSVLANPGHEDHQRLRRWVGRDFDPAIFDLPSTNTALQRLARAWRSRGRRKAK